MVRAEQRYYQRVDDPNIKHKIEFRSENWRSYRGECNYYIQEQRDARDRLTGNVRIVRKSKVLRIVRTLLMGEIKEIIAKEEEKDWLYYTKETRLPYGG